MSAAENEPLWHVTAPQLKAGIPLADDRDYDVAIVGAGFTGLRAALALAEAGTRVAVFDTGDVGHGASGRSGGQVNPMLPVARPDELLDTVGRTYFERLAEVSLGSADQLFDLVRRYNIDCDARQHGWLRANHSPAARERTRKTALEWNRYGGGFEFIDGDELRQMTGSPAYDSATFSAKGGAVQPLSFARGLAKSAIDAGAEIFTHTSIRGLERQDQRWVLSAAGHRVVAATRLCRSRRCRSQQSRCLKTKSRRSCRVVRQFPTRGV